METRIRGEISKNLVKLLDVGIAGELYSKGYGIKERGRIFLNLYEAAYLSEMGWLEVKKGSRILNYEEIIDMINKQDKLGLSKYIVYRDLRSKGYVVREGFGHGLDFRVYERGEYGEKAAKYLISVFNEGSYMKISRVKRIIDLSLKMGKEPVLAVVDRRGEVVYYRMFKMGIKF